MCPSLMVSDDERALKNPPTVLLWMARIGTPGAHFGSWSIHT